MSDIVFILGAGASKQCDLATKKWSRS